MGLRVTVADLRYAFGYFRFTASSLLALNVLAPVVTILVCKMFAQHAAMIVALVTLSIAPVGALFSQDMLPLVARGHAAYARGLFFASTVLSAILTPLAVAVIAALYGSEVHVNPLTVARIAIDTVLAPLGLGLAMGSWWPATRAWNGVLQKISALLLFVCGVVWIAGTWSAMATVIREGTLTAIALIAALDLTIGHFFGGPEEDDRTVLAFATVSRHPGVAIVVASLTDQPLAPIGVLLAVLVSAVVTLPYRLWRKRRQSDAPGTAGHSPRHAH
jgi:BASS family bile acid:Na+ symporter